MEPTQEHCLICNRIQLIQMEENPYFVAETKSGYVVIGDHQFFRGYTLLLSKEHKRELHELGAQVRDVFLRDMAETAEAVIHAFGPEKLNYELLGNTDQHLHWHLIPRHADDPNIKGPAWNVDKDIRNSDNVRPNPEDLRSLKQSLLKELLRQPGLVVREFRTV